MHVPCVGITIASSGSGTFAFIWTVLASHEYNPQDQARAPEGKIWRKIGEGLAPGCTAKGSHVGSGGRVVKMLVAISFGKGVIFCEQYDKLDGDRYVQFIEKNFQYMFRKSGKQHSKLFVQDNCPVLNCAKARKALSAIGARLFAIPSRSPDVQPIENVFHLVKRELRRQALQKNITFEGLDEFAKRVKSTLYGMKTDFIDNIISSMDKRMEHIVRSRGNRTKY